MDVLELLNQILEATKDNNYTLRYQNTQVGDTPTFIAKTLFQETGKVAIFYNLVEDVPEYFAVDYSTVAYLVVYPPSGEDEKIMLYPVTGLLFKYKELAVARYVGSLPKTSLPSTLPLKNDCSFNPLLPDLLTLFISNRIIDQAVLI